MAYKRDIDRLPIPPADAKVHNVVCHYCIVGCGYHAYSWDVNRQGGPAPGQNAFGADLREQQPTESEAGTRRRCTTSSARTGATCTSSSSPTRTAS
jgi:arsenite oxidase large subunit